MSSWFVIWLAGFVGLAIYIFGTSVLNAEEREGARDYMRDMGVDLSMTGLCVYYALVAAMWPVTVPIEIASYINWWREGKREDDRA